MIKNIMSSVRHLALNLSYRLALLMSRKGESPSQSRVLILPGADGWEGGAPFSFGDEMLAVGLISGLKESGCHEIDALSLTTEISRAVKVYGDSVRLIGLQGGWLSLSSYWQIRRMARDYSHFVVIGADVLDGAYSEINSTQRLKFLNILARKGLKTVVTGLSFNGTDNTNIRSLFCEAERNGAAVYAREKESLIRLRSFLNAPHQSADLAFKVNIDDYVASNKIRDLVEKIKLAKKKGVVVIAVNICGWHIKDMEKFYSDFVTALADRTILPNVAFVLIPHDTRTDVGSDLAALCELKERLSGRAVVIGDPAEILSGVDAKHVVGVCDVLITGRMHLAIAALHQKVPAVSFSYQGKFEGLYDLFDLPRKMMVSYDDPVHAVKLLSSVVRDYASLVGTIENSLPSVLRLADKNFSEFRPDVH